ncbi:glutathione S-transferase C-terminal-like protein [Atractiella rhizophila]|nr:glutathione S-transferase C-terminal-like protein [Atractiella rhizophila]
MSSQAPSSKSGLTLYSWPTPNGVKLSIALEELKQAGDIPDYAVVPINIGASPEPQKQPDFLAINPNGRIPALHDSNKDFSVFESGAILLYLAEHYSPSHKFDFSAGSLKEQSELLQWIFFQAGGLGPMAGQLGHFKGAATKIGQDKAEYGINRYAAETKRLLEVYEKRLEGRDYLVGEGKGKYSFADIMTIGWARLAPGALTDPHKAEFPNVKAWVDRIEARPAVQVGLKTPPRE